MKTVGVFRRVLMFGAHAYFWVLLVSGVVWSLLALLFAFGPWDPAESCYCDDVLAAVERVDWTGTGEGLTFRDGASSHATELTLRSDSAVAGATPSIVLPFDISWSPTGPHYDGPADRIGTRLTAAGADPQPVELDWYRSFRFEGVTIEVIREHRVVVHAARW